MFRTFIAGLTALSLSLAPASPASAMGLDEDDVAKLVFGLITLGALSTIIDDADRDDDDRREDRDRDEDRVTDRRYQNHAEWLAERRADRIDDREQPFILSRPADRGGFVMPRGNPNNRGVFGSRNVRELPRDCLKEARTHYGTQRFWGQRCMEREFAAVRLLPGECRVRLISDRGPRSGWDPACLRDAGYRVGR